LLLNTIVKTIKRKSHRGSQTVTTDQITLDIIACINEAIRDVAKLIPKRYYFKQGAPLALVAGTIAVPAVYSLPSDCQELILLHYTANNAVYRLAKIDSDGEWISKIWNINQNPNRPLYYRELGSDGSGNKQIEIFPIPDASYSLNNEYYKIKPTDLTVSDLSTEIPTIPDSVQDVVEKGALYYFLKGFDDGGQMVAKKDYEDSKIEMEVADERDIDSDNRLRFNMVRTSMLPPGFSR